MKKNKAFLKVITKVGSMAELGRILGVSTSQISHLASGRAKVPYKHIKKLIKLSEGEITREELRPDLYED